MAKVVTVNVRIKTQGDGLDHTDTFQFVNNNAPAATYQQAAAGFNSLVVPANGVAIVPPASMSGTPTQSGVSKTLKGAGGDVGIPLDPAVPHVLPITGGFGLTYGAAEGLWMIQF